MDGVRLLLLDTFQAVVSSLQRRASEVTATALLEETRRVLNGVAAEHWRASSIAELPEMVRELARDRDDFKSMSIAYRDELTKAEARVKKLELALEVARDERSDRHEAWCSSGSCDCQE